MKKLNKKRLRKIIKELQNNNAVSIEGANFRGSFDTNILSMKRKINEVQNNEI